MTGTVLTACGYADRYGLGGGHTQRAWEGGPLPSADSLSWSTVSETPFPRFGSLDGICKITLAAVEMLGMRVREPGDVLPDAAIVLGTHYGCTDSDVAFYRTLERPGGASPKLFPYTLPSTAIAHVAIRYRLGGPNACVMAGPESGLVALVEGLRLLWSGEASACVCIAADAVGSECAEVLNSGAESPSAPVCSAYALLVETVPSAERHGRSPLATIESQVDAAETPKELPKIEDLHKAMYEYVSAAARGESPLPWTIPYPEALRSQETLRITPRSSS